MGDIKREKKKKKEENNCNSYVICFLSAERGLILNLQSFHKPCSYKIVDSDIAPVFLPTETLYPIFSLA